jgi:hypothetical protein
MDFGTGIYAWHAHTNLDVMWALNEGTVTAGRSDDHLVMTFGSAVTAVGGNFTAIDDVLMTAPNTIVLTLADATTWTTSSWAFVGFVQVRQLCLWTCGVPTGHFTARLCRQLTIYTPAAPFLSRRRCVCLVLVRWVC